ncbi:TetR/AcrR family transcriptional regulator [Nocardia otitidiscaviarum]|uniref:TetR/AcrR family transcriptional regulator n=1 Tax=Nocardia otitidiscaviarum TaxID=1823 RepID=UPI0004A75979|nr:TetR/AcrR family transcriptional regulator [Nocardia otitidiscaviarum]MBF6135757.1 TetR/AcrR family transcriptional regulator [Nocardia otitidiscaviarum]MBF6237860.1 TetR/AcrR family transcriptional regulator [Nocardia otitidiscaviarum]MBF6483570.1 TetR/AcrR family transcriptional regulator [Nocardia otitidiscaviarum]
MSPKRVDKTARRQEILDAAVRVFARKGFAASRIDDVAAAAGIAKGSVYLYFDSRDALLEAAFEQYSAEALAAVQRAVDGDAPALDRLAELVRGVFEVLAGTPDHARILFDLWATDYMKDVYREQRRVIAGLLAEIRPDLGEAHATVIVGVIEGVLLQWLVDPDVPIGKLAQPMLDIVLDGLRERP